MTTNSASQPDSLPPDLRSDAYPELDLVHRAPRLDGNSFNPVPLIRSVNGLWRVGKDQALATIANYVTLASSEASRRERYGLDEQRAFLILRVLFVRNDGQAEMPALILGAPDIEPPQGDTSWPLFPVSVQREIPFLLVSGYGHMFGGAAQSALDHVEFCRQQGKLREQPLVPETCPLTALKFLLESDPWRRLFSQASLRGTYERMLFHQALRALGPLYSAPEGEPSGMGSGREFDGIEACRREIERLVGDSPVWEPERHQFVSGSSHKES